MARIRSIKPEFCSSKDTGALSRDARLCFLQLFLEADDAGRMLWIPRKIVGVLYPHDETVDGALLVQWVKECAARAMVAVYEVASVEYLQILNWAKHQKISNPTASRLPSPEKAERFLISANSPEPLQNNSGELLEPLRSDLGYGSGIGIKDQKAPPSSAAAQPTAPADMAGHKAARLAAVTQDAITAFNAILAKPTGLLPAVHKSVGRDKRQKQVGRCLKVVREICQDQYGNTVITPQFWEAYFGACAEDPFKSGKQPPGKGHENWTPTFEYLTREAVVLEVYDKSGAGEEAA